VFRNSHMQSCCALFCHCSARSKQDEELLEKLNRGRQRQKNKREPTMLVTQELLDELRKEEVRDVYCVQCSPV